MTKHDDMTKTIKTTQWGDIHNKMSQLLSWNKQGYDKNNEMTTQWHDKIIIWQEPLHTQWYEQAMRGEQQWYDKNH